MPHVHFEHISFASFCPKAITWSHFWPRQQWILEKQLQQSPWYWHSSTSCRNSGTARWDRISNLSPAKRSTRFVQSPLQSKRYVQFHSTPPTHNSRSVHAQSPQEFAVYKTGNIHFLNDDDDFKMQLPKGARVSINLPGGMNLRFKISKWYKLYIS
jgi:hypothetical protein